jgi:hypothetical protein
MAADIQARNGGRELMVVSPDVGGVVRARALAKRLDNAPLAIVDKRRDRPGQSEVMNIIGDVKGRTCILIDDIIDSGGTLCNAAQALMNAGAASVTAYITHGVLSGPAVERIGNSVMKSLVVTDSIEPTGSKREEPRVPFGWLVERGLLQPGEVLSDPSGRWTARVRADGTLISAEHKGSIHQVGAAVQGAPACNGWTFWCVVADGGKRVPIDVLRAKLRADMN